MNSDFKIVISLSHRRISFEYYLKGGAITLQPIKSEANRQGEWPAPFSIYCSPTGIIIGEDAYHAAQRGTKNAFDGLFECMETADCYYEFCGTKKHVSDLPLDACETIFRDFFSKVLLNNYGNLEQNRSTMPIVFVCEEDISDNQKAIINNKFKNSGYGCVSVNSYRSYIETFARSSYSKRFENALIVWTEGKDLYLTLIDIKGQKDSKTTVLPQLGVDPRQDFIIDEIWKAVMAWNYYLEKDKEIDVIKNAANRFLNSTEALVKGSVTLSDGNSYNYELERKAINHLPNATRIQLASGVREFLAKNDARPETTMVILRGVAANNNYFSSVLESFPNIIVSDNDLRSQVMRTIIEEPIVSPTVATPPIVPTPGLDPNPIIQEWKSKKADVKGKISSKKYQEAKDILNDFYEKATATNAVEVIKEIDELRKRTHSDTPTVKLTREWRELKATTKGQLRNGIVKEDTKKQLNNFLIECKETDNTKLINEVEQLINEIKNIIPSNKGNEIDHSLDLNREWKQLKATANGELRSGNIKENTKKQLSSFLIKCKEINSTKLINEVEQLINSTKPQITKKEQPQKKVIPSKVEKKVNDVEIFLQNGKLVEARDWFKNNGEIEKANNLTEIIKLEKSVIQRKKELSSCQQTKDLQKIKRIITEISNYIDKCKTIGIPVEEYKQILLEYKKIK